MGRPAFGMVAQLIEEVLRTGVVPKVAQSVIRLSARAMAALHVHWAGSDERQKHQGVDGVGLWCSDSAEVHGEIAGLLSTRSHHLLPDCKRLAVFTYESARIGTDPSLVGGGVETLPSGDRFPNLGGVNS